MSWLVELSLFNFSRFRSDLLLMFFMVLFVSVVAYFLLDNQIKYIMSLEFVLISTKEVTE